MSLLRLSLLVLTLSLCIWLALSNPTMDDYLAFVEAELGKAMDRGEGTQPDRERAVVRSIFRSHSRELVGSMVRPRTVRQNWGLASVYETTLFDSRILVLGIGGRFIPMKGVDEAILRLGRMAF
ncbi:MAG TPA: DUF4359 domain-containing protein [Nitrospira sp.]|nr:DUF4359 domain-containing protein [Nitrospira sp.]